MQKPTLIIFAITLAIHLTSQANQNLSEINKFIESFIDKEMKNVITKLKEYGQDSDRIVKVCNVSNDQDKDKEAHAVNIAIEKASTGFELQFLLTKKKDIEKRLESFNEYEWELQRAPLVNLIKKIIKHEDKDNIRNVVYFNIIEDVKLGLKASIANHRNFKLEEMSTRDSVRYEIFNNESLIAIIVIEVVKEGERHYMKVWVTPSRKGAETKPFMIRMITRKKENFDAVMADIISYIDFKDYFNNNQENFDVIRDFFQQELKISVLPINIESENDESKDVEKKFTFKFENYRGEGKVKYIAPINLHSVGSYIIDLAINGTPIKIPAYHRMRKADLIEYLRSQNLREHFLSIRDEIFKIFEAKYKEYYGAVLEETDFELLEGGFFSTGDVKNAKNRNSIVAFIKYNERNNRVTLGLKTLRGLAVDFEYQFGKEHFKKHVIEEVVGFLMRTGAAKIGKNEVL